jgi:hypothetical protein
LVVAAGAQWSGLIIIMRGAAADEMELELVAVVE